MMRRVSWFLVLPVLLCAATAQAAGYGAYFEYSYADGRIDYERDNIRDGGSTVFLPGNADYETNRVGVGVVLDTAVARDRLFNYRFQLGYQHGFRDFEDDSDGESNGVMMNHAFGFGVFRNEGVRLWGGPALRVQVDIFSGSEMPFSGVDHAVDVSGGLGPMLGFNWHMGPLVSGSLTLSYQYMFLGEIVDFHDESLQGYDGREHLVALSLSVLFRSSGDQYDRHRSQMRVR